MRRRLAFLAVASTLCGIGNIAHAQSAAPVVRSASVDIGAALDEQLRVVLEPAVVGRVTLGLSFGYSTRPESEYGVSYPMPAIGSPGVPDIAPCSDQGCSTIYPPYYGGERVRYRASTMALHARWYPALLSREGDGHKVSAYLGEFLSYSRRRITTTSQYYPYYPVDGPRPAGSEAAVVDTAYYPRPMPYPVPTRYTQHLRGWEPGVELGVRAIVGSRLLIDLGASTRLVTIDDPRSPRRPGDTDPRLVAAIGIAW